MTDIGINFRATSGFVTDGTGQTYCLDSDTYPTTRGGATFGWEDSVSGQARDRDSNADPRLAGIIFTSDTGGVKRFRIDLDATGDHTIESASGDASSSNGVSYEFRDNTTAFGTDPAALNSASEFHDATGVKRTSEADWIANQASLARTFTSQIFRYALGTSDVTGAANLVVAHVRVVGDSVGGGVEVSLSAAATAGSAFTATAAAGASISAGISAGDADAALNAAQAALTAVVETDAQYAAIAQAAAAIQAGLEAGETWAAIAAADAGITEGAELGASFVGETEAAQQAALEAGTEAAAQFLGAVAAFALLSAGATAADAFAASASVVGAISEAAQFGATFATTTSNDGAWAAAASVQAAFVGVVAGLGELSAQAEVDEAFSAIGTALAAISIGVSLGAVFSASSSADVSIIGATASVRAIRRMSATVQAIGLKATIN